AGQRGRERYVICAKYYNMSGTCIEIGGSIAMPAVDGFRVVEVIEGELKATEIEVRPFARGGPAYPRELSEGKVYPLRLTPTERTKRQLLENEQTGNSFVWVDGNEIEEQIAGK